MKQEIELNEITKKLPKYLHKYILKQPYDQYTAKNQATWRYVMRSNVEYLEDVAHKSYIEGLKKTGISTEVIPEMEGMNRILKDIGWAAVSVDGFIPPNAFMAFQAYNVLVIASDIRTTKHIEYTPAPDIIHEAAGHAPIIANKEYAEYLRRFGELGSKAISSAKDFELYEAIRLLSILKENPNSTKQEVKTAEDSIVEVQSNMGEPSEMSKIRNMHWWTVEYGLIGSMEDPKIYGAGLLSSIGESKWCMTEDVAKIPYSIAAADKGFDITKAQPQLYITPSFAHISKVLEEFANTMAVRKGGLYGVKKLVESGNIGTIELSTGVQVSGVFTNVIDSEDNPIYIQTTGGTALSYRNTELIGHATQYHKEGFGSPIGKLKNSNLAIEDMTPSDLERYNIEEGLVTTLVFEGGITVKGKIITGRRNVQGKIILISFEQCTVSLNDTILFDPSWGTYDMIVGKTIVSAYAGAACETSFEDMGRISDNKTIKIKYSEEQVKLDDLYKKVRIIREAKEFEIEELKEVFQLIKDNYSGEWLICLEIYELTFGKYDSFENELLTYLNGIKENKNLIKNGLELIK
ncbi:MAG: aromatic amino acid hydroxylase [Flavobacteriaceae bacterium]|nr:aromatic amino acid hydroxylase [Flavobacteriaceae bacterium]